MSDEKLDILKKDALKAYSSAGTEGKAMLTGLFPKVNFNLKITDRVQSFQDILDISGKTMESLVGPTDKPHHIATKQWELIAEVYNEGTVMDPFNTKQYKYFPWARITPGSGFGLSYHVCDHWCTHTYVGVRLCFKESGLAKDAFDKFTEIYATMMTK